MPDAQAWVDIAALRTRLDTFFGQRKRDINRFGSTVNQTFEAFVFAQVVEWYRARPGYSVEVVNPKKRKTRSRSIASTTSERRARRRPSL